MWDERFREPGFAYGSAPNDFLVEVGDLIPAGRVLCLAEGEGRNAAYLATRGYDVLAVDQSAVGLDKAKALATELGVTFETRVADLAAFEFRPGGYNGIVSIWAHVPSGIRRSVHKKCVGALAPGGVMILEAYTPDQVGRGTGGPPDRDFCMTAEGLREEFAGLDFEMLVEKERAVHEGKYHTGNSAVVQMVARRPAHGSR